MPTRKLSYEEIADDLAARIAAGEYTSEIPLPSYTRIAEIYSVGRSTAQAAIRVLRYRGLVESQRGRAVWPVEQSGGTDE
jgi:DNA-binding GntR family transcriptional regulator